MMNMIIYDYDDNNVGIQPNLHGDGNEYDDYDDYDVIDIILRC